MKRFLIALYFLAGLAASSAFGSDARYTLTEYTMERCGACIAAEKDVAEIVKAGIDVRRINTSADPIGDAEARRFKLQLRPAWRLENAQNVEIARWYGAGKGGIIIATIRAKFPTQSDQSEPIATAPEAEEQDAEESQEPTVAPQLAPSALAELDALKDEDECDEYKVELDDLTQKEDRENEVADFRERKPVSEPFLDSSFLDRSLDEWENRNNDEEEEEPRGFSEPGESDARLGNRIAEKAAAAILDGLDPKITAIKRDALAKFESIGEKATKRLEDRVGQEFQSAKDGLTARFNDAIGDVRSDVLKELSKQINEAVKHLFFNVLMIALACFGVWLAIRVIKKKGTKQRNF